LLSLPSKTRPFYSALLFLPTEIEKTAEKKSFPFFLKRFLKSGDLKYENTFVVIAWEK